MDTDSRIVIAIGVVKSLTDIVQNKKIPLTLNRQKIMTRLSEINSKLMALKWSYKPLEQVLHSKELREIEIFAKEIFDELPEKWVEMLSSRGVEGKKSVAELTYLRDFFYTMRERITKGFSDDYADAIDIFCGEILSIEKLDAKNWKCVVADGQARYNVITNISDLKKGEVVPIAKLPPQIVHGVLSEGMFMGSSAGIKKFTSEEVGKRPELEDKDLGQARGILQEYFVNKK
ncbi:MAG: hypothetical protein ACTSQB_03485 [Candidatus Heimdallarchaeota archaeon]